MATNTRKRKNVCQDTLFIEVNDDELSPEEDGHENSEPNSKTMKTDKEVMPKETFEIVNLEIDETELFVNETTTATITKSEISSTETENCVDSCDNKPKSLSEENKLEAPSNELDARALHHANSLSDKLDVTDSTISIDSEIHISFGSKQLADLYKTKFMKFIETFIELETTKETELSITVQRDSILNSSEWIVLDETTCINQSLTAANDNLHIPSKSKKKKAKKKKKDDDFFVVDINPSETDSVDYLTKYSSKFQINTEDSKEDESAQKIMPNQDCFNCSGNHTLRDCPFPKDFLRINAARNKLKAQKLTTRYHLEEEQKYGHLTPGKISSALKKALGIRRNELPPYIYRMRRLGYPPGWLEEAKYFYSNLDLFDAEGNTVRQNMLRKDQGLNPEKIIEYPGFNTSTDKYIKDDYKNFGVPPYSDIYSKESMIMSFEKHFANQQDDYETCEMEVDVPEKGDEENKEGPRDKSLVRVAKEIAEVCLPSPSLLELEKQKENLLLALEDNCSSNIISEDTENLVSSEEVNDVDSQDEDKLISVEDCASQHNSSTDEGISDAEKSFLNNSNIKTSAFGTPILKSNSPYSKLPNMNNFTKDVSPVINFENLPNSTGKYEQMTGVLQKVRNKMKGLQNCKS